MNRINNFCTHVTRSTFSSFVIPGKAHAQFFLNHNLIFHEKARVCPCHFVGKKFKDSDLQKYSHRGIDGTKANSFAGLIEHLTNLILIAAVSHC